MKDYLSTYIYIYTCVFHLFRRCHSKINLTNEHAHAAATEKIKADSVSIAGIFSGRSVLVNPLLRVLSIVRRDRRILVNFHRLRKISP